MWVLPVLEGEYLGAAPGQSLGQRIAVCALTRSDLLMGRGIFFCKMLINLLVYHCILLMVAKIKFWQFLFYSHGKDMLVLLARMIRWLSFWLRRASSWHGDDKNHHSRFFSLGSDIRSSILQKGGLRKVSFQDFCFTVYGRWYTFPFPEPPLWMESEEQRWCGS